MRNDERLLLEAAQQRTQQQGRFHILELAKGVGIHQQRAVYLCQKWGLRGWYDYDATALEGWMTEEGMSA